MITEEIKNEVKSCLESFIMKMNEWEKTCNKIATDNSLSFEEQFQKQKSLLLDIFNQYCTSKERKNGKPNTISYGDEDSYEYDLNEEKIVDIISDDKNTSKLYVYTFREDPLEEKFEYVFIQKGGRWLIDSKKIFDESKNKWSSISL